MTDVTQALRTELEKHCGPRRARVEPLLRGANGDAARFAEQLVREGLVDRETAGAIVAGAMGRTYVNLGRVAFQDDLLARVPADAARKARAIPIYRLGAAVTVAMADPSDETSRRAIEAILGSPVSVVFSFADEVESAIRVKYHTQDDLDRMVAAFDLGMLAGTDLSEAALARLVDSRQLADIADALLLLAIKEGASDVHLEPGRGELLVRLRVDGAMQDRLSLPARLALPLASRFKVCAGLDITERRRPQDGRLRFALPEREVDVRLSALPALHGEKLVLRILGTHFRGHELSLDRLDMAPGILARLRALLEQPNGILFASGPTGSGKTTTLYAALAHVNRREANVVTIEDPVEYELASITQVPVNERIGRGFATVLRAVLRQDPDVILVGEIRDVETARVAAQAAMTGHLVLTTLHTSDAIQAITRMIDMGVESFVVAPSVIGVLNQRLVRRLCDQCREPYAPDAAWLRRFFHWRPGYAPPPFYRARGCEQCGGTGFRGRIAIHEFLPVSPAMRTALLRNADYAELRGIAVAEGFRDLRHDGFKKALRGLTTLEQVVAAVGGDGA